MQRRLLLSILGSSILLYVLHAFAMRYDLYYSVSWADSVTHALAGGILALIFAYGFSLFSKLEITMGKTLIFVLIVGIIWEILEARTGMTLSTETGYVFDTVSDLFFDIFGAYIFTIYTNNQ